jgi:hypothetical protein
MDSCLEADSCEVQDNYHETDGSSFVSIGIWWSVALATTTIISKPLTRAS